MRRHPPLLVEASPLDSPVCARCRRDALDPVHWPPVGLRERLLDLVGLLR